MPFAPGLLIVRFLLMCASVLLLPQTTVAQGAIIRGRVTVAETQAPLVGALVQMRQLSGAVVTTTTTSETGSFATSLLPLGTYTVRILRIGFRPFEAGRITISTDGASTMDVVWIANPIPLATMLVKGERTCRVSADSGTLIANVWEEAHKALLSSIIAEQSDAPEIERVNYNRFVDSAEVVRTQAVSVIRSNSFRSYASWAPESLAVHGYFKTDNRAYSLFGPDAATLFSDSFAGSHCYSLRDGAGTHANDIGLAFTPIKSADKMRVDIAGTFWIDRISWALQSVEYQYEGGVLERDLDVAGLRRAGGLVEFGSLPSGQWLVTNWRIARPVINPENLIRVGDQLRRSDASWGGFDESGGMITTITHKGVTQYERTLPALSLRITSNDAEISGASAEIRVAGVDKVFVPDPSGLLRLPGIPDGTYSVSATFPAIASFTRAAMTKLITVRGADAQDSFEAPTLETVARDACGPKANFTDRSAVFGKFSVGQQMIAGARLLVQWPALGQSGSGRFIEPLTALTNADGRFLQCNVPRGIVSFRTTTDLSNSEQRITLNAVDAVQRVSIDLSASATSVSTAARTNVEFLMLDAKNNPVSMQFEIINSQGKRLSLKSDDLGRAILADQPLGVMSLLISKANVLGQELFAGYNLVRFTMKR